MEWAEVEEPPSMQHIGGAMGKDYRNGPTFPAYDAVDCFGLTTMIVVNVAVVVVVMKLNILPFALHHKKAVVVDDL